MAKQPRKPAPPKPTIAHPLFPAVVAMWFGALFGLGSLAVRPSLLESLVIKSRIDLVLPAAAPPLGITARILVALILAAIGCVIGIIIARRLGRPKPEVRERKRKTLASEDEDLQLRRRDTHPDAPARRPLSASDELGEEVPAFGGGVLAARRRSLTLEHDEQSFVPHEFAPLPGAGVPQVFDIAAFEMTASAEAAPLDLGSYAEPGVQQQTADTAAPLHTDAAHDLAEAADAAAAGQQVFGLNPQPAQPEAARQIFGQPIEGDHVSQDFVKAAGFQTTVFETPEPTPLFAPRELAQTAVTALPETAGFAVPQPFEVPPAPQIADYAVPETTAEQAPTPAEAAPAVVAEALPPLPSPAGLGMTDLASRLAESMARRRAARAGEAVSAVAMPEPAPVTEPVPNLAAPIAVAPVPVAFEPVAPAFSEVSEPVAAAPFTAPDETATTPTPIPVTAAVDVLPAALRPLDLDGFEDDDDTFESLLPPRLIAMPPVLQASPVAAFEPAQIPSVAAPAPDADSEAEAEVGPEDNYGSLLGLAVTPATRPGPVRIEEPEAELAEIEPVVIFPGQMARMTDGGEPAGSFRRFDAPATAEQGQPVAASPLGNEVDRGEADQALRMALANLQRMSGAA